MKQTKRNPLGLRPIFIQRDNVWAIRDWRCEDRAFLPSEATARKWITVFYRERQIETLFFTLPPTNTEALFEEPEAQAA